MLVIDKDHKVIFDDFRNVRLEEKADMIFVDPPFAINFKANMQSYNRKSDSIEYVEVSRKEYPKFINDLVKWCYDNLKDNGSLWLVSGWNNLKHVLNAVDNVGFHTLNHCISHYQFGVFTKRKFTTSHYHVLLLVKNPKDYTFNKPEHYAQDVWYIKRKYNRGKKTAGNELPDQLVEKCIITSSNEGDLVVDTCLGSGTTMKACLKLNRRCIGIEINPLLKDRILEKIGVD